MYYLKLGPNARQFFCPTTKVLVPKHKIVEVNKLSDFMRKRIKGGHLVQLTEKEAKLAMKEFEQEVEAAEEKDPRESLTMKQIIEEEFGYFDDEDKGVLRKIKTKKELLAKGDELAKAYDDPGDDNTGDDDDDDAGDDGDAGDDDSKE